MLVKSQERTECYECNWIWFIVHSTQHTPAPARSSLTQAPAPALSGSVQAAPAPGERDTAECCPRNDNNNHNPRYNNSNLRNLHLHTHSTVFSSNDEYWFCKKICTQDNNLHNLQELGVSLTDQYWITVHIYAEFTIKWHEHVCLESGQGETISCYEARYRVRGQRGSNLGEDSEERGHWPWLRLLPSRPPPSLITSGVPEWWTFNDSIGNLRHHQVNLKSTISSPQSRLTI